MSICQLCVYICAHTCLAAEHFPPICFFCLRSCKTILFPCACSLDFLCCSLIKKETSASEYSIAFWTRADNDSFSLFLSRQTDITYHCSVSCLCCRAKYLTLCGDHSLQYVCAHTYIYCAGARQSPILLAKSPCIHIKRVHMAGNAAKRKNEKLKLEKDLEYSKRGGKKVQCSS